MPEINTQQDIFSFVKSEENRFNFPITIREKYEWGMKEHITEAIIYKNGQVMSGKLKGTSNEKPVKNIIKPILNTQYRLEGFDVKNIELYVDDKNINYMSFVLRKYHDKWVRENGLDTFIDEAVESYCDFGGTLSENSNKVRPETVPLESIAFCDQTDILGGPIAFKYWLSPDKLKDKEKLGWGDTKNGATISIDDLIKFVKNQKTPDNFSKNDTPGGYIEIYKIHGVLPKSFFDGESQNKYSLQLQIISFYKNGEGNKIGVVLFKKELTESLFKFLSRDPIYGRALGSGGVEEIIESQIWTNFGEIRKKQLLDACARIVHLTDDTDFYAKNRNLQNIANNQVLVLGEGKTLRQMDSYPRSLALFEQTINDWEQTAMRIGATTEPLLGEPSPSDTPFRSQERQVIEGKGIHEYRKGKIAVYIEEIYRDWIISHLAREVSKDQEFLTDLSFDELQEITEQIAENKANRIRNEQVLDDKIPQDKELLKQEIQANYRKSSKKFIKIFAGEMKKAPIRVKINIIGKQKDLAGITDKLVNIVRQVIAAPQILENPQMAKIFNQILEYSNLSPIDFGSFRAPQLQALKVPQLSPIKEEVAV